MRAKNAVKVVVSKPLDGTDLENGIIEHEISVKCSY